MKKFLENDIKILALPLSILLGIVVLSFVSANIIFNKIGRLNQEVTDDKKSELVLQTKLTSLQKVNQEVSSDSTAVTNALPATSSVLATINQLQFQSNSLNLVLENIKSSSNITTNQNNPIVATEIDFDADGVYPNLSTFIKNLKNLVPITRFDSIRINSQNSSGNSLYRLSASLFTYWAPLPTVIPSIGEPLVELNPEDQKILTQILSLPQPATSISSSSSSATVTIGRSDPFNN